MKSKPIRHLQPRESVQTKIRIAMKLNVSVFLQHSQQNGTDSSTQRTYLFPGGSSADEVEHGESVDNDKLRAAHLAHALHHLDGQADAVLVRAAPLVRALVRALRDELVD